MTLSTEDLRAALDHAVAVADLDATAPATLDLESPPTLPHLHTSDEPRPRLRRPALVAAALIAVLGLGGALVVIGSDDDGLTTAGTADGPSGPVVAVGLDAPGLVLVDTSDDLLDDPGVGSHPLRTIPRAEVAIFTSSTGATIAVADRDEDGDGSFDHFADALDERSEVAGVEVRSASEAFGTEVLDGLDASTWWTWSAGPRAVTVASRGLAAAEHDDEVRAFVEASLSGRAADHRPAGFVLVYAGPDDNPFYRNGPSAGATYRTSDGDRIDVVQFDSSVAADQLDRWAWYRSDGMVSRVDGHPALLETDGGSTETLWIGRPHGLVVVAGPAGTTTDLAGSLVDLDEAGWTALRARATEPGTIHQTATTEAD